MTMGGKRITAEAIEANRHKNLDYARRERDRLAKQRKAAAERAAGIRRCRKGHLIDTASGSRYCAKCRAGKSQPVTEAVLVDQIIALDRERELHPSHEWPRFRAAIAKIRDRIDELDRAGRWRRS